MDRRPNLHAAIMNLPTDPEIEHLSDYNRTLYKTGHKEARHAAAELAQEHTAALIAENARLRSLLQQWATLDAEAWHPTRYRNSKTRLFDETSAALSDNPAQEQP